MSQATDLNLNQVGKYKAAITVKSLPEPKGKVGFIEIEGQQKKIKYWVSGLSKLATPLTVGASAEAEIECKESEYNGDTIIEAWLTSFGGASQAFQGKGGGARPYTPKSEAEIHSASIAGIVKSCLEQTDLSRFDELFDKALDAYCRGIERVAGKAEAAKAMPQPQADAVDTNWLSLDRSLTNEEAREGSEYWRSIGGSPEAFADIKHLAPDIHPAKLFLEAKRLWLQDPVEVIRLVVPSYGRIPGSGVAEPGDHRNGTRAEMEPSEYRKLFFEFCESRNWPLFATAPDACKTVYSRVLGRQIKNATQLKDDDYQALYHWVCRVDSGEEEEPMSFKARAKEAETNV